MQNKDLWLYSWDDEHFNSDEYESKKEAIKAAKMKKCGKYVYVGKKEEVGGLPDLDVENILWNVQEEIDDEYGEVGDGWILNIKKEHIDILNNRVNEVLSKWVDEFGYKPKWSIVSDTERVKLKDVVNEN
ncbi:TPA: hypothetical protein KR288_002476 [Clostridioides difficile]|nr:hypothetical protein [Clostridioides difficile]